MRPRVPTRARNLCGYTYRSDMCALRFRTGSNRKRTECSRFISILSACASMAHRCRSLLLPSPGPPPVIWKAAITRCSRVTTNVGIQFSRFQARPNRTYLPPAFWPAFVARSEAARGRNRPFTRHFYWTSNENVFREGKSNYPNPLSPIPPRM